ncbi:hypothetical protein AB0K18_45710 [Nonomuraea sp. NPDC049421]|uniref:hypothetical protein n=1 Tax=Nonomuraea sp. NPDC049421 TaxID=3155275 RepID=UPI00343D5D48
MDFSFAGEIHAVEMEPDYPQTWPRAKQMALATGSGDRAKGGTPAGQKAVSVMPGLTSVTPTPRLVAYIRRFSAMPVTAHLVAE